MALYIFLPGWEINWSSWPVVVALRRGHSSKEETHTKTKQHQILWTYNILDHHQKATITPGKVKYMHSMNRHNDYYQTLIEKSFSIACNIAWIDNKNALKRVKRPK